MPETLKDAFEEIRDAHTRATELGEREIERLALEVLRTEGTHADEFTKGMGTWFFSGEDGLVYATDTFYEDDDDEEGHKDPIFETEAYQKLDALFHEWDSDLKFSGGPLRLTLTSRRTTW